MKTSIKHLATWLVDKPGELTMRNVCGSPRSSTIDIRDATCIDCLKQYQNKNPTSSIVDRRIAELCMDNQLKEILDD